MIRHALGLAALVFAALAVTSVADPALAQKQIVENRAYVFAARATATSGYGFVDVNSIQPRAGRREVDILLIQPRAQPGRPSHMAGRISMNCQANDSYIVTGQTYDARDRPLGPPRPGGPSQTLGRMDAATHAMICRGVGRNARKFTTRAHAVAWVRARPA